MPKHATDFYKKLPKTPISNMIFRQELMRKVTVDPEYAGFMRAACRLDPFFYFASFCIAEGTPVVTDRGPVPIEEVSLSDRVWDGEKFVRHDGILNQGSRPVIFAYRTWMTPDHKVSTNHGWQIAEKGHDRADVRLPDGYSVRWSIQGQEQRRVALSVPVRQGVGGVGAAASLEQHEELRLLEVGENEEAINKARAIEESDLCGLEFDAPALREPQKHGIPSLRCEGNLCLQAVEEVRELLSGHGGTPGDFDSREERQRRELQTRELPLGDIGRAGQQHAVEPQVQNFQGRTDDCPVVESVGDNACWDQAPNTGGSSGRCLAGSCASRKDASDFRESHRPSFVRREQEPGQSHRTVYDIVNCGPRQAFTVLDADGSPLLVHNCYTMNPSRPHPRKKVPFLLYPFQERGVDVILDSLEQGFDVSVEKSRQMGASWLFSLVIQYCWLFRPGQNFLMLSRSDEYVDRSNEPKSLFYKLDFINNNLPKWLLPTGWDKKKHRFVKRMINPANGNTIVGEATTDDSGRGGTFTAVLHDEFGACDVGMGILKSTRAATSTRWFNSTPKGTGNAHYRIVQLSRQNPQQVRPLKFHWSDHPDYAEGIYKLDKEGKPTPHKKTRKRDLDSYIEENADLVQSLKKRGFWGEYEVRSKWFDIQCSRATTKAEIAQEVEIDYGGAGYQFFDSKDIHELISLYCTPPKYKGDLELDWEATLEPYGLRRHGHGNLELWCELIGKEGAPPARPYVIGVDAAAGTGASNSVLSIWDAKSCEKVGQYVDPNIKPERLAKLAIALCKWFWDSYMIWETNGSGRAFGDAVIEWGFGRYYKRPGNVETNESGAKAGWAPTRDNKYQLLSQYRGALADRTVCNRCEQAMTECLEYLFLGNNWVEHASLNENEDPSGARDQHGDRVIADALAAKVMGDQPKTVTEVKTDHSPLLVAGRRELVKAMEEKNDNPFKFN